MADKPTTFVLNDETVVNSYGFRVKNSGIQLARFKANPVILAQHWNSVSAVIGKWENIRIEGPKLLADAVFDMEDEDSAKIAGKVDRGYLKGCSIGFGPGTKDADWNFKKDENGVAELLSCELFEASIVAIPSNSKAVRLYSETGVELSADSIQLSLSSLTPETNSLNTMEKIILSAPALVALGLPNNDNPLATAAAVEKMAAEHASMQKKLEAATQANTELQTQLTAVTESQAKELVDGAITAGKLSAAERESYMAFAKADLTAATTVIGGMEPRKELGSQIKNPSEQDKEMTAEKFCNELSAEQQKKWKEENPDAYKKLFA